MPALRGEEEELNKGQSSFSQRLSHLQLAAVSLQRACRAARPLSAWKWLAMQMSSPPLIRGSRLSNDDTSAPL